MYSTDISFWMTCLFYVFYWHFIFNDMSLSCILLTFHFEWHVSFVHSTDIPFLMTCLFHVFYWHFILNDMSLSCILLTFHFEMTCLFHVFYCHFAILLCLVDIKKRSFLTSSVFWFIKHTVMNGPTDWGECVHVQRQAPTPAACGVLLPGGAVQTCQSSIPSTAASWYSSSRALTIAWRTCKTHTWWPVWFVGVCV